MKVKRGDLLILQYFPFNTYMILATQKDSGLSFIYNINNGSINDFIIYNEISVTTFKVIKS